MKLGDIAEIRVGLVLARKKADSKAEIAKKYKVLTLKSFENNGYLNTEQLDNFESSEELSDEYLTQQGDVVIRLSEPNTAVYIDENLTGLVIPSLFCVIRINSGNQYLMPEFLTMYLNSSHVKRQISKYQIGTTIATIPTSFLRKLNIKQIDLKKQMQLVEFSKLYLKEKGLLNQLIDEKEKLYTTLINKIINF